MVSDFSSTEKEKNFRVMIAVLSSPDFRDHCRGHIMIAVDFSGQDGTENQNCSIMMVVDFSVPDT